MDSRSDFIKQRQKQKETVTILRNLIGNHKDDSELVELINKQVQYLEKKFTPTTESKKMQAQIISNIAEQITGKKIILETEVLQYDDNKEVISEEDGEIIRQGHPIPLDSSAGPISISSEQIDGSQKNIINSLLTQLNKYKDDPQQAQQINTQNQFLRQQTGNQPLDQELPVNLNKQQMTESEEDVDPETPNIVTQESVDQNQLQRKVYAHKDQMSYDEWDQFMFDVMFGDDKYEGISNSENLRIFTSSDQSDEDQIKLISEWISKNKLTEDELRDMLSFEI